jgi:indolepyruvate ferredoxin oxidoreductase, beta subunit
MIKNDNKNNINYKSGTKPVFLKDWGKFLNKGEILSVLFTGVGGQGIILATRVLAECAINWGYDVKVSEIHGMAQRGGSVEGSVRVGNKVFSPIINNTDFIVALEKLEGLRYLSRLSSGGFIIINDYEIIPVSVFLDGTGYPDEIENRIKEVTGNYMLIKAVEIARELGNPKASNLVLLGTLSNFLPFNYDCWINAIKVCIRSSLIDINIKAFDQGRKIVF